MNESIYFDPYRYLPYQRNFIFINSERSIGKTYSTQKMLIEQFMKNKYKFVYVTRGQDQSEHGVMEKAFSKMLAQEFPRLDVSYNKNMMSINGIVAGYSVALTAVTKLKNTNFDGIKYMMFDEYIIDYRDIKDYIGGLKEPEILLNIYHTIDREADNVICFFLANTISYYNPYHLYKAFGLPTKKPGKNTIWKNEFVIYHHTEATAELKKIKSKSKFLRMIENTDYYSYANSGEFFQDNENFVRKRMVNDRNIFNITLNGQTFGIWYKDGIATISFSFDPQLKTNITINYDDHSVDDIYVKKSDSRIRTLLYLYAHGQLFFETLKVKKYVEILFR